MKLSRTHRGVTLTEMLVVVAVLAAAVAMTKLGFDWLNALARQRVLVDAQWQAQVALYDVRRAVRNSESIVNITSGSLTLTVFQPRQVGQGFGSAQIFTEINRATVTFEYVTQANETFLRRRLQSRWGDREQKLLVNLLVPPEGNNFMFHPYPAEDLEPPYDAVDTMFRLQPRFMTRETDQPILYRAVTVRRARGQEN